MPTCWPLPRTWWRSGGQAPDGSLLLDDDFLVLVNAWWEPLDFAIPSTRPGQAWEKDIDTYLGRTPSAAGAAGAACRAGDRVTVGPRSVSVLRGPRAAGA